MSVYSMEYPMRTCKPLVLSVVLCLGAVTGIAAPTGNTANTDQDWYSVEILVFRYTGPEAAQRETWPPTVAAPSLKNAIYPPAGNDPDYRPLTRTSTAMAQARQRLANTGGYDPVVGIGWMQPGTDPDTTRPVSLHPLPSASSATPGMTTGAAQGVTQTPIEVAGTATLAIAANKPYIQLDLRLCEPPPPGLELQAPTLNTAAAPATATAPAPVPATSMSPLLFTAPAPVTVDQAAAVRRQCFALQESHQVTPGQMEYFDTAAFGVLALVQPVTPPAPVAAVPRAAHTPD